MPRFEKPCFQTRVRVTIASGPSQFYSPNSIAALLTGENSYVQYSLVPPLGMVALFEREIQNKSNEYEATFTLIPIWKGGISFPNKAF